LAAAGHAGTRSVSGIAADTAARERLFGNLNSARDRRRSRRVTLPRIARFARSARAFNAFRPGNSPPPLFFSSFVNVSVPLYRPIQIIPLSAMKRKKGKRKEKKKKKKKKKN